VLYCIGLETVDAARDAIKIKVAAGIGIYHEAIRFIQSGAARIGTSPAEELIGLYKSSISVHSFLMNFVCT
jgi:deoxyribose-phosphate aldolase